MSIQRESNWLMKVPGLDKTQTIYFNWQKYEEAATALIKENSNLFEHHNLFL